MSVELLLRGNLGSNLFQYALARTIAERHGWALHCRNHQDGASGHLGRPAGVCRLSDVEALFPTAPLSLDGGKHQGPLDLHDLRSSTSWDGQTIDLPRVLSNPAPRRILLNGYFQRWEYYVDSAPQLRRWFTPSRRYAGVEPSASDVLIVVRRGHDYASYGWTLPASYYAQALSQIERLGTVHVCGVGIDDNIRDALASYAPVYHDTSGAERYVLIKAFRRVVLSNDVCAWWPAYLSDASVILAPKSNGSCYAFTGFGSVDLHMREPRYKEVPVVSVATVDVSVRCRATDAHLLWDGRGGRLYVQRPANNFFIPFSLSESTVARLVLHSEVPILLADVQTRFPAVDVKHVCRSLCDAGLATAAYVCSEPVSA